MEQPSRDAELKSERELLVKADRDIEQGQLRLRRQQGVLNAIRGHGRPCEASDRLVFLTSQVLVEWEKHRTLIAQRIAYLEERLERDMA